MRNKILVVEKEGAARDELDQILQNIIEEGGEVFFTEKVEDGLILVEKEQPIIVFLDRNLIGDSLSAWKRDGMHLILTLASGERYEGAEDFVIKPFSHSQILEKCRPYLSVEVVPPILPM